MKRRFSTAGGTQWDGLIGLLVGVAALIYLQHTWPGPGAYHLYGDAVHYNLSARVLLTKHFYTYWGHGPDAQVTPGYPLFLALCYAIASLFSKHPHAGMHVAFFVQLVLAALTASVLYYISRRALNRFWSIIVGLLWAVYPSTHFAYGLLLTEAVFVPLLCGFVWLLLIAAERRRPLWWFLAGLTLGLASLVRPTVLPLILAGFILLFGNLFKTKASQFGAQIQQAVTLFVTHAVGFLIPLVPWWIRNWVVFHRILLTDTDVGNPLLFGSDPNFAHDPTLGRGLSATQQEHLAIARALHGLSVHPWAELKWYTVDKLGLLFGTPWLARHPLFIHLQPFLVIAGAIGLLLLFRRPGLRLISWITLFLLVTQLPFLPIPRYAFPMMPFLFIGLGWLLQRLITPFWKQQGKAGSSGRRRGKSEANTA